MIRWLREHRTVRLLETVWAIERYNDLYGEPNDVSALLEPARDRLVRKLGLPPDVVKAVTLRARWMVADIASLETPESREALRELRRRR